MKVKHLIISFLFLISVSFFAHASVRKSSDWYPYLLSEKLDPSSPANMGRLVLDAPAGKHGFVKAQGNRFVFQDGTPARFWGTNLCFTACFPTKENAKLLADRLAFFGFNAVRLHHMDFFFEPAGIFKDTNLTSKDPQRKRTGILSPSQLDRLDYLIYQLTIRGIYVDMNLLVSRHFTTGDGVSDAARLDMAAKPVSLFDPKLSELQKKYAYDLLTHTNQYTGLRYCDDPAIALVETTNENSLFDHWKWDHLDKNPLNKNSLPDFYLKQLDASWNSWLKQKYGTIEAVKKVLGIDPRASGQGFFKFERPSHRFQLMYSKEAMKDLGLFYISVEKRYVDDMRFYLKNELGVKCPITGIGGPSGSQDVAAENDCDFIDSHTYWDHPQFAHGWSPTYFQIANHSMLVDKNLGIAGNIASNRLADKPFTITEWNHCLPNQYTYETPTLIASQALKYKTDGVFQFAFSHDEPTSSKLSQLTTFFDTIANPQQLLLTSTGSYLFRLGENPQTIVADAVFQLNSRTVSGAAGKISGRRINLNELTITSDGDGAVFIYSTDKKNMQKSEKLILVIVGEVKNKDSRWELTDKYNWGISPVLLKTVNVDLLLNHDVPVKIYRLGTKGERGKEIPARFNDGKALFSIKNSNTPWFEITTS